MRGGVGWKGALEGGGWAGEMAEKEGGENLQ